MAIHEKNTLREIGTRLKELRKHLDYSRNRMAVFLEITPNGYGKNECGETFPGLPSLRRLSEELRISMDWLIFNRGSMYFQESQPEIKIKEEKKPGLEETPEVRELLEYMEQEPQFKYEVLANFYKYKKEAANPRD
jgi:transcriptional regulator with XRE-family HTH domain